MRRVHPTGPFKKDLKRVSRRGWKINYLYALISIIQKDKPLPPVARPHKLSGEYKGLWECHVESDWLLIYDVTDREVLLVRTGSHADLFE